jgi:hypothetical protein
MLNESPRNERLDILQKCFLRVAELIKKGSYCDFTIKMEDGKIVMWTITLKEKP